MPRQRSLSMHLPRWPYVVFVALLANGLLQGFSRTTPREPPSATLVRSPTTAAPVRNTLTPPAPTPVAVPTSESPVEQEPEIACGAPEFRPLVEAVRRAQRRDRTQFTEAFSALRSCRNELGERVRPVRSAELREGDATVWFRNDEADCAFVNIQRSGADHTGPWTAVSVYRGPCRGA